MKKVWICDELYNEIIKIKKYYESKIGLTLSFGDASKIFFRKYKEMKIDSSSKLEFI